MSEKFYITTSIAYANADPHIGFAYESFLADALARFHRKNKDVFFLTGVDEHGLKIAKKAQELGVSAQSLVDKFSQSFLNLDDQLDIAYDDFIRTSDQDRHWPGAQELWKRIETNGDIYKKHFQGLYCSGCEAFITEKELDQDGNCPTHKKAPEKIEEENYFFKLSEYTQAITEKIQKDELMIFPESAKSEMLSFLRPGLSDISFSRKQESVIWGMPVVNDPDQLMYVWCDALSNYISALGFGRQDDDNFQKFWPADMHVVGKDIVRFHAIIWPAMLMSAGLKLPKSIFVHGFITADGQKMSKSLGNVIDPKEVIEKWGSEALRYYLARELNPFEDSDFTMEKFKDAYNANLANGLGNLISRTLKMSNTYFSGQIKVSASNNAPIKSRFYTEVASEKIDGYSLDYIIRENIKPKYKEHMKSGALHLASDEIWNLIKILDGHITEYEPYKLIKEDREKTEAVLSSLLSGLIEVADMLDPVMPKTAEQIRELISQQDDIFQTKELEKPLFPRI